MLVLGFMLHLNDFVGHFIDRDGNKLSFVLCDCAKTLADHNVLISSDYCNSLSSMDIQFQLFELDIDTNEVNYTPFNTVDNASGCAWSPMFLTYPSGNAITFYEDDKIWKIEPYEKKCYIGYECLANPLSSFGYYEKYNKSEIFIQLAEFIFNDKVFDVNPGESEYDYVFAGSLDFVEYEINDAGTEKITSYGSNSGLFVERITSLLSEYPKCEYRNGNIVVKMLPFAFFKEETSSGLKRKIAEELMNNELSGSREDDSIISAKFEFSRISAFYDVISSIENKKELSAGLALMSNMSSFINEDLHLSSEWNDQISGKFAATLRKLDKCYELSSLTFDAMKSLEEKFSFLTYCTYSDLKIISWFENDTGINFLNDYALDLDLTCYIDSLEERSYKVGYGNGYKSTRYIKWDGDVVTGGHENLSVNVNEYIRRNPRGEKMKIVLGLCWHYTTEAKIENVHVTLAFDHVVESIPIQFVPEAKKDCKHASLVIEIDKKTRALTYRTTHLYPVVKVYYKEKLMGVDEGTPDVALGFLSLTEDEMLNWSKMHDGWRSEEFYCDDDSIMSSGTWVKFHVYSHKDSRPNNGYDCASFLMTESIYDDTSFSHLQNMIVDVLSRYIGTNSDYLDLVTKMRVGRADYTKVCANDIFFGWTVENYDRETGVNMIYYGYLNPDYYRDKTSLAHQIDAAMLDYGMQYSRAFEDTPTDEDFATITGMFKQTLDWWASGCMYDEYISSYVNEVGRRYISLSSSTDYLTGFVDWAYANPDVSKHIVASQVESLLRDLEQNE